MLNNDLFVIYINYKLLEFLRQCAVADDTSTASSVTVVSRERHKRMPAPVRDGTRQSRFAED